MSGLPCSIPISFLATSLLCAIHAQPAPRFEAADLRLSGPNTIPEMRSRLFRGRYELRNATAVDLIRTAWNIDAGNVVGGPEWLDSSRFDLRAAVPANVTPEALRTMLQAFLKDRFQLAVHIGNRDVPAFAVTAGKKPLMPQSNGSRPTGCDILPGPNPPAPRGSPQPPVTYFCGNMTVAAFAKALPGIRETAGYLLNRPVLDRTGLEGNWDFKFTWSPRNVYLAAPPAGEAITIFDAFEKQLGLKLSLVKVATAVVVIDGIKDPKLPAMPLIQPKFEVADIRPNEPEAPCGNVAIRPGGSIRVNMTLRGLILETLGENNTHRIVGGPKSLDGTCYTVVAKAPAEEDAAMGWNGPVWNGVDIDTMRSMLRALLADRFGLVAHYENRPVPGYALMASKPKLRKADPANRTGCKEGPGPDGKDPRLTNPLASRLLTCRNMTLVQFAAELNRPGNGAGGPVVDATEIDGRYDITINFSSPSVFSNRRTPKAEGEAITSEARASEPDGAISIFEALKQLGLKLESRQVMAPAFVIDHLNDTPTEN